MKKIERSWCKHRPFHCFLTQARVSAWFSETTVSKTTASHLRCLSCDNFCFAIDQTFINFATPCTRKCGYVCSRHVSCIAKRISITPVCDKTHSFSLGNASCNKCATESYFVTCHGIEGSILLHSSFVMNCSFALVPCSFSSPQLLQPTKIFVGKCSHSQI